MNYNKVIGGEFTIDPDFDRSRPQMSLADGSEYGDSILFASGREALRIIIHSVESIRGIALPDYICGSVPVLLKRMGIVADYYHINENFYPDTDILVSMTQKYGTVLLVNYFGMIDLSKTVELIRKECRNACIIIDGVQNYFGLKDDIPADYAFTSLRKWFSVPDGAIIYSNNPIRREYLHSYIQKKEKKCNNFSLFKFGGNVLKNYRDIVGDDLCLKLIEDGEKILDASFDDTVIETAINWTSEYMKSAELSRIAEARKNNAKVLHEKLDKLNIKHLYSADRVPLHVPIVLGDNRDNVRNALRREGIFCPVHWPNLWFDDFGIKSKNDLYDKELSLICDQRYCEEDMRLQLEIIEREYRNS